MQTIKNIRDTFAKKYLEKEFVIDKSGSKTIELVNACFLCDENIILGALNHDYVARELEWYLSLSLNVNDIPPPIPQIWKQVADPQGFINSNYGWAIFSNENGYQYINAKNELLKNSDSRRSIMIYTRPQMHIDYNKNGRSDFICTNTVQTLIRNNKLTYIVNQRSCDAWAGFRNDLAWHQYVYDKLLNELREVYVDLKSLPIMFNIGSLHFYEKQFYLVDHYIKTEETFISKIDYDNLHNGNK